MGRHVAMSGAAALLLAGSLTVITELPRRLESPVTGSAASRTLAGVPLSFVENRGQADPRIAFHTFGSDPAISFGSRGLGFTLSSDEGNWRVGMDFAGVTDPPTPVGTGRTPTAVSYLTADSGGDLAGLRTYSRVRYESVWPGIDAAYRGAVGSLKYHFVVEPGADPSDIALAIRGAREANVNVEGQLELATPAGTLVDEKPVAYQLDDGGRIPVSAAYSLDGDRVGFEVGAYDPSLPLVVDPAVFVNAGYVGGALDEPVASVAVTSTGEAIVAGSTSSSQTSFPDGDGFDLVPGFDQMYAASGDVFVVKVNAAGTGLDWATYLGGTSIEFATDVAVDSGGNAYVVGRASGTGIETGGSFDAAHNGSFDAFVAKLSSNGLSVVYGGFIGGTGVDQANAIAVDSSGRAYVTGSAASDEMTFPDGDGDMDDAFEVGGFDQTYNGDATDAFFARVNAMGTALEYASYLGGADFDDGLGIAVDSMNRAYVGGVTPSTETSFPDGDPGDSNTFPVATGFDQTFNGTQDGYLVRTNATGTSLEYATYVGGVMYDEVAAVDVAGDRAYVGGRTLSTEATFPDGTDFPADGDAFDGIPTMDGTFNGVADGWVGKLTGMGTGLDYVGYIGGAADDLVAEVALDAQERTWATGAVSSDETTFPDGDGFGSVTGPDVIYNTMKDAFAVRIGSGGTALDHATYIGGNQPDEGLSVAVDASGKAYLAGITKSDQMTFPDGNDFPNDGNAFDDIPGSDQSFNDDPAENDAFLVTLRVEFTLSAATTGAGSGSVTATGISCGGDCSEVYGEGTSVGLTATPAGGSYFAGWSGACSGTGACVVTMSDDMAVTATFEAITAKSVQLTSNKNKVIKGKKAILTAVVSPCAGHEGDTIDLYRNGVLLVTGTSNQACTAVFPVKIKKTGQFQAVSPVQDEDHSEGRSAQVKIKAKKKPS